MIKLVHCMTELQMANDNDCVHLQREALHAADMLCAECALHDALQLINDNDDDCARLQREALCAANMLHAEFALHERLKLINMTMTMTLCTCSGRRSAQPTCCTRRACC